MTDDPRCPLCRSARASWQLIPGTALHDATLDAIHARWPDWTETDRICAACLSDALADMQARSPDPSAETDGDLAAPTWQALHETILHRRTFGERVADGIAAFVGSWTFLIGEVILLILWMLFNALVVMRYRFDPYPFIFLNLVLSWAAAIQAPLVLMSQNRQDARDRMRDENEYRTNVVAEREIREIQRRLDQLQTDLSPQLAEIQRQQQAIREQLSRLPIEGE